MSWAAGCGGGAGALRRCASPLSIRLCAEPQLGESLFPRFPGPPWKFSPLWTFVRSAKRNLFICIKLVNLKNCLLHKNCLKKILLFLQKSKKNKKIPAGAGEGREERMLFSVEACAFFFTACLCLAFLAGIQREPLAFYPGMLGAALWFAVLFMHAVSKP